jgi:hypothetical protein
MGDARSRPWRCGMRAGRLPLLTTALPGLARAQGAMASTCWSTGQSSPFMSGPLDNGANRYPQQGMPQPLVRSHPPIYTPAGGWQRSPAGAGGCSRGPRHCPRPPRGPECSWGRIGSHACTTTAPRGFRGRSRSSVRGRPGGDDGPRGTSSRSCQSGHVAPLCRRCCLTSLPLCLVLSLPPLPPRLVRAPACCLWFLRARTDFFPPMPPNRGRRGGRQAGAGRGAAQPGRPRV